MVKKLLVLIVSIVTVAVSQAHNGPALRRIISTSQPMWIIHIDTWNNPDPQRIIDLVPEDIKPYVVFNLSLSATQATCPDGEKVCDSWMKVCARNRVWTMIQCASGACSAFPDDDLRVYEKYFKEYPNFLGWNFAEQFWGFGEDRKREVVDEKGQIQTVTNKNPEFLTRLELLRQIYELCHQYGGYLAVSFTQACYSANMMPVAYMKRNAKMRELLTKDKDHFLCCEKYTMTNGFFDIESNCLGAYLGGYAGQYGIRFDACGWYGSDVERDENGNIKKDSDGKEIRKIYSDFPKALGAIPILEHVTLTGETVIDGPETIPLEDSREILSTKTADGYTHRNWGWFPHFRNINIDMFRKILDGTIRIPTRSEVIARTKVCIQNDIAPKSANTTQNELEPYLSPETLYDGLYRQDCDHNGVMFPGSALTNRWWTKSTGRYPAIPVVYDLLDDEAKKLTAIKSSEYNGRWGVTKTKQTELNRIFPAEYSGKIYASRLENTWVTYNPYQYDEKQKPLAKETHGMKYLREYYASTRRAAGKIPFKYNTCTNVTVDYAPYTSVLMRETSDQVHFYLQNYRLQDGMHLEQGNPKLNDDKNLPEFAQQQDILKIVGATSEPTITWKDRGDHSTSTVNTAWDASTKTYTITVKHNGPLDIDVKCSGNNSAKRETKITPSVIEIPAMPDAYDGEMQYEFENFDYKNIESCMANAWWSGDKIRDYFGQGCLKMGTKKGASLRGFTPVPKVGNYKVVVRYMSDASPATLKVTTSGGVKTITLPKTTMPAGYQVRQHWAEYIFNIDINDMNSNMQVDYVSGGGATLDCITLNYAGELTAIEGVYAGDAEIDHVEYYDLQGIRMPAAKNGMNIRRVFLKNGKSYTEKYVE